MRVLLQTLNNKFGKYPSGILKKLKIRVADGQTKLLCTMFILTSGGPKEFFGHYEVTVNYIN